MLDDPREQLGRAGLMGCGFRMSSLIYVVQTDFPEYRPKLGCKSLQLAYLQTSQKLCEVGIPIGKEDKQVANCY